MTGRNKKNNPQKLTKVENVITSSEIFTLLGMALIKLTVS